MSSLQQFANQANAAAGQKVLINAKEFEAKYGDKPECYKFLAHDCGTYLPSYDCITVWHLRDLASGKKKRIQGKNVMHIMIPQYDGLSVAHILRFGMNFQSVVDSLPDLEKETLKFPRQYIANVVHTRVGAGFSKWVDDQVKARHAKVVDTKNMAIELDPEIAEIFRNSTAVSSKYSSSMILPYSKSSCTNPYPIFLLHL